MIKKLTDSQLAFIVAAIAFLVYSNSLFNGFTGDDHRVILNNPALHGSPLSLLFGIDTTSDTERLPFYRPFTYLTFYLEAQVHQFNPFLVRLFNVLLHCANAMLLFRLARIHLASRNAALLAAILFALHPLHSEAVNFNAGGRNTMLACFFLLSTYLLHNRYREHRSALLGASAILSYLLGLFSKETAIMILPFIIAMEFFPAASRKKPAQIAANLVPYCCATICYLILRWLTLSKLGIQTTLLPGVGTTLMAQTQLIPGFLERIANNIVIIPGYLKTVLMPTALSPRYASPPPFSAVAIPVTAAWLIILASCAWLLTRGKTYTSLFGIYWLLAFWLPVSGIVYFSGVVQADRFLYIPAIGLWLILADQIERIVQQKPHAQRYISTITIVVILLCSVVTIRRNSDWKSDLALNSRLVQQYPDNPHGHYNLASAYIERRGTEDLRLAEEAFKKALALDVRMTAAYTPLGFISMSKGDLHAAIDYYSKALEIEPNDRDACINRALAYEKTGNIPQALDGFRSYLAIPGYDNVPGAADYAVTAIRKYSKKP